jgi:hypothetical protein
MENKAIKKATFAVFRAGESFADKVRELKSIVEGEDFHKVLHTLIVACDEFYYKGSGEMYVARTRGADIGLGIAYNKDHADYAMRQKQINRIMQALDLTEPRNPSSKPKKRIDAVGAMLARIHKQLTPAQIRALKAAL